MVVAGPVVEMVVGVAAAGVGVAAGDGAAGVAGVAAGAAGVDQDSVAST